MNIASHSIYSTPASVLLRELLLQNQLPPILSEYLLDSLESSGAQFYPSCHWVFLSQQTGSPIDFGKTSGIKPFPVSIKTADAVFKHLLAAGMVLWLQASNANECKITYQKKKDKYLKRVTLGLGEGILERSQRQHCQKLICLIQSTKICDCEKLQDFNFPIQLRVSLDSNYYSLEEKKAIDREKVTFYGILALKSSKDWKCYFKTLLYKIILLAFYIK